MARQLIVYATPSRECAHADEGCCPKCMDPMAHPEAADWRIIKFSSPKDSAT